MTTADERARRVEVGVMLAATPDADDFSAFPRQLALFETAA